MSKFKRELRKNIHINYKILNNLIHKLHNLKQILYFVIIQFTNNTFKILIHIKLCL